MRGLLRSLSRGPPGLLSGLGRLSRSIGRSSGCGARGVHQPLLRRERGPDSRGIRRFVRIEPRHGVRLIRIEPGHGVRRRRCSWRGRCGCGHCRRWRRYRSSGSPGGTGERVTACEAHARTWLSHLAATWAAHVSQSLSIVMVGLCSLLPITRPTLQTLSRHGRHSESRD